VLVSSGIGGFVQPTAERWDLFWVEAYDNLAPAALGLHDFHHAFRCDADLNLHHTTLHFGALTR
jgi:hypothetical protein